MGEVVSANSPGWPGHRLYWGAQEWGAIWGGAGRAAALTEVAFSSVFV